MTYSTAPANGLDRALSRVASATAVVTIDGPEGPLGLSTRRLLALPKAGAQVLWALPGYASHRDDFCQAEHFALHILAEDQLDLYLRFNSRHDDFIGYSWAPNAQGVPLIDGCLARFECQTHAALPAGPDMLILGGVEGAGARKGRPLLHYGAGFGALR